MADTVAVQTKLQHIINALWQAGRDFPFNVVVVDTVNGGLRRWSKLVNLLIGEEGVVFYFDESLRPHLARRDSDRW